MLDKEIKQIYPQLHVEQGDPVQRDDGVNYRLKTISDIQQQLNRERDTRNNLYKKYKRAINVVDIIDTVLNSISVTSAGFAAGSIALAVVPIGLPLACVSVTCGVMNYVGKYISRKLDRKLEKHAAIRIVCDTKLNSIQNIVSKSLTDNHISDSEFKLIMNEFDKYQKMKEDIRTKVIKQKEIDESLKKQWLIEAKAEARKELVGKLN